MPVYFESAETFRAWLARHHATERELWVGIYKKDSGKGGLTYAEALDEALCFGWIDGVRKRVDAGSFMQRFSPRTARSVWSAVNTRRVAELTKAGRMDPAGLRAFRERDPERSRQYSYEREACELAPALRRRFRAKADAWRFFGAQSPSYRRVMTWWIMSAKKDETRCKRLDTLIAESARGRRLGQAAPQPPRAASSSSSPSSSSSRRARAK